MKVFGASDFVLFRQKQGQVHALVIDKDSSKSPAVSS